MPYYVTSGSTKRSRARKRWRNGGATGRSGWSRRWTRIGAISMTRSIG